MERFNQLAALIFARLYENFPVPLELTPTAYLSEIIETDDYDGAFNFDEFFGSTVKWLERAGFVWIDRDNSTYDGPAYDVVLSERGLATLRSVPNSLEGTASLGERFANFSREKASEAVSTLIAIVINAAAQGGVGAS